MCELQLASLYFGFHMGKMGYKRVSLIRVLASVYENKHTHKHIKYTFQSHFNTWVETLVHIFQEYSLGRSFNCSVPPFLISKMEKNFIYLKGH